MLATEQPAALPPRRPALGPPTPIRGPRSALATANNLCVALPRHGPSRPPASPTPPSPHQTSKALPGPSAGLAWPTLT